MFADLSIATYAAASLSVTLAALLQGTLGFGFALVLVPALALIEPRLVPVPVIVLSLMLTSGSALRERHAVDWRRIGWVLVGQLPGTLAGLALIKVVDQTALELVIAIVILIAVALMTLRGHGPPRTPATSILGGVVSACMHMIAAISGPPLVLLFHGDRGPTLRASLAAVFFIGGLSTLTMRALAGEVGGANLLISLSLAPALYLGFWGSRFLIGHADGARLRTAVLVFAGLGGLILLLRALG